MIFDSTGVNLLELMNQRLTVFFGSGNLTQELLEQALRRTEACFMPSNNKRYCDGNGNVKFSIFHSGQASIFLYYLSNSAFRAGNIELADKCYYLNKIMHALDWFYEIELPACFGVEHPVGSVLGRASYGEMFFLHQNCTVGTSIGKSPTIGKRCVLCANSSIFGECKIGDNVIISAGCTLVNQNVPNNSIVYSNGTIKTIDEAEILSKIGKLSDFKL